MKKSFIFKAEWIDNLNSDQCKYSQQIWLRLRLVSIQWTVLNDISHNWINNYYIHKWNQMCIKLYNSWKGFEIFIIIPLSTLGHYKTIEREWMTSQITVRSLQWIEINNKVLSQKQLPTGDNKLHNNKFYKSEERFKNYNCRFEMTTL